LSTEIRTKENSLMEKQTEKEFSRGRTERYTTGSGSMVSRRDTAFGEAKTVTHT
jgi:hypothetical protein